MRDAVVAALLTVLGTSIVGSWVVLRGLTFLGDSLAQGVLPGIAVAWALSVDPQIGALVAAFAMVAGVNVIRSSSPLPDDVSLGILCVGFLALAVVLMSARGGYGDLNRFLFGSITAVDDQRIIRSAIFAGITIVFAIVGYRLDYGNVRLLASEDREILAQRCPSGFARDDRPHRGEFLRNRRVPLVLRFSLPRRQQPRCWWRSKNIGLSIVLGALAAVVGLLISYHHRTAAGATMALFSVMMFFLGLISHNIRIRAVSA